MIAYRIVEIKNNKPHSLFHGTGGKRELPMGVWIKADKKLVRDGSPKRAKEYEAGFHVLLSADDALKFFNTMFRIKENRRVIQCEVKGIRPKSHSHRSVFLADEMKINSIEPIEKGA